MDPEELADAFGREDALLLTNPRRPYKRESALRQWSDGQAMARDGVIFQTSGSETTAKFVCLSRNALTFSCAAVNKHLKAGPDDVWLGVLPLFHVGGFSIPIRARLAGVPCHFVAGSWSTDRFLEACRGCKASLTSLVPTQVYDLVEQERPCPSSLRAVLVGGGALAPVLRSRAHQLGWPLLETYGMTETASQVATEPLGATEVFCEGKPWLTLLDGWEVDVDKPSLWLRGPALFSGYVVEDGESFRWVDPLEDRWFATRDVVEWDAAKRQLRFLGRHRHMLKIKGELVNLQGCRDRLAALAGPRQNAVAVVPLEDLRRGARLVLVGESAVFSETELRALRRIFNADRPSGEHVTDVVLIPKGLPRTALGKLEEGTLKREVHERLREIKRI